MTWWVSTKVKKLKQTNKWEDNCYCWYWRMRRSNPLLRISRKYSKECSNGIMQIHLWAFSNSDRVFEGREPWACRVAKEVQIWPIRREHTSLPEITLHDYGNSMLLVPPHQWPPVLGQCRQSYSSKKTLSRVYSLQTASKMQKAILLLFGGWSILS